MKDLRKLIEGLVQEIGSRLRGLGERLQVPVQVPVPVPTRQPRKR